MITDILQPAGPLLFGEPLFHMNDYSKIAMVWFFLFVDVSMKLFQIGKYAKTLGCKKLALLFFSARHLVVQNMIP